MGLKSDALREFQAAVELCQRRDLKREAFDLLKRVASLDPSNITNRLNLADLLQREGLSSEAREEYAGMLAELTNQSGADLVIRVAEQALESFPDFKPAMIALVGAKLASGEGKEALEILDQAADRFDGDVEIQEARINVYEGLGDAVGLRQAYTDLAGIYKKRGDAEKARDILQRHCSIEGLGGDESTAPSILLTGAAESEDDVLDPEPGFDVASAVDVPEKVDVSQTMAAASLSLDDMLAEARVSYEFGDPDEARQLVKYVLSRDPEHEGAKQLLSEIRSGPGRRGLDVAAEQPDEAGDDVPELDLELEAVAPPTEQAQAEPVGEPDAPAAFEQSIQVEELPDIEILLEDEEDADDVYASVQPPAELGGAPVAGDDEQIEFELDLDDALEAQPAVELESPPAAKSAEEDAGPEPATEQEQDDSEASAESTRVAENLEEAEFFMQQGMLDEAERVYRLVLEMVPEHPQAMLRLGEIEESRGAGPDVAVSSSGDSLEEAVFTEAPVDVLDLDIPEVDITATGQASPAPVAAAGEEPASEELDLSDISSGDLEGALADLDLDADFDLTPDSAPALELEPDDEPEVLAELTLPPTHAPLVDEPDESVVDAEVTHSGLEVGAEPIGLEPEPLELPPEVDDTPVSVSTPAVAARLFRPEELVAEADEEESEGDDAFDLAAELEQELSGGDTAPDQSGHGFDDVFSAFKKGIEDQIGAEDADAHYDLAIAYKEMGLLEDALRELELVQQTGARLVETLSLLARCKLDLGRPQEAVTDLKGALQIADSAESELSLRYELGEVLVASGKPSEALEAFKKVAAVDPAHREVQDRIAELQ
jgi:tetratricopeptide (TPR) repeat protein